MAVDQKARDLELWREWKRSNSPIVLQQLLDGMGGLRARECGKWANSISRSLLEAEAKRLSVIAFKEFDPNRGVALSTFVTSRLQKISRLAYSTMNAARSSESTAIAWGPFHTAQTELRDRLGREPSAAEMADHMGWSLKRVGDFQRQTNRKEFMESEEGPSTGNDREDFLVDMIYHDLAPMQQKIFEHSSGYRGAQILDGKAMMKRLKITQGQLSYQKTLLVKAIEKVRDTRG